MQKTIAIADGKTLTLDNSLYWLYAYRAQFGVDITKTLVPIINGIIELYAEVVELSDGAADFMEVLKKIPPADLQNAVIELSGLELVDVVNIVWALAKCADNSTPEPETWARGFDTFPLDVILPETFRLVASGLVTSKNLPAPLSEKPGTDGE